jgi:hypothetical protein
MKKKLEKLEQLKDEWWNLDVPYQDREGKRRSDPAPGKPRAFFKYAADTFFE